MYNFFIRSGFVFSCFTFFALVFCFSCCFLERCGIETSGTNGTVVLFSTRRENIGQQQVFYLYTVGQILVTTGLKFSKDFEK